MPSSIQPRVLHVGTPTLLGLLLLGVTTAGAQEGKSSLTKTPPRIPAISERMYLGGSAKVVVTGAFAYDAEIEINTKASYSDGEKTWLQFGDSGSPDPNLLITYGDGSLSVSADRGSDTSIGESPACSGWTKVEASAIEGEYRCKGIASYNTRTHQMGTVDVTVRFTAKS